MDPEERAVPEIPFVRAMGIEIVSATRDEVRGRLPWSPDRRTSTGVVHGGALMALGDTLGAVCAFLNLPSGTTTATIESHTNFLRAVRVGAVEAVSRPVHVGRRFIVLETDLLDSEGRLAGRVTQTQAVLEAVRNIDFDESITPP